MWMGVHLPAAIRILLLAASQPQWPTSPLSPTSLNCCPCLQCTLPSPFSTILRKKRHNKNPNIPSKQSNAYRANTLVKTKMNGLRSFIPSTVRVRRVPPFIHLILFLPHTIIGFQSNILFTAIKVLWICFSVFKPLSIYQNAAGYFS